LKKKHTWRNLRKLNLRKREKDERAEAIERRREGGVRRREW
jgi:hypothetical protein